MRAQKVVEALAGGGRDEHGVGFAGGQSRARRRIDQVDLVHDEQAGHLARADLREHVGDRLLMGPDLVGRQARVGHDEQQVGGARLLERRGEGVDQKVRQLADEADRVGDQVVAVAMAKRAGGRIERLEEAVAHRHAGVGERVQQRRLAGVGVAGQGEQRHIGAHAARTLRAPRARHALDAAAQGLDALADDAAIDLELLLAGAAHVGAGAEARQDLALTAHAGELVLELGQVDLQAALERAGMVGEHGQDQLGAVEHVDVDRVEHRGHLGRRQVVFADGAGGAALRRTASRSSLSLPGPR